MPKILLTVSHLQQQTETDCLPVCAQMVMIELGFTVSYSELINLLGTKSFGTPFRNIKRLEQLGAAITIDHLSLAEIETTLITCVPLFNVKGCHSRKGLVLNYHQRPIPRL